MGRNQSHSFFGAINNHSFSAHPKGGLLSGAQSKPLILAHPKGWLTKWATANATHVRHIRKDGLLSGAQEPINAIAGNKALFSVQNHDTYYAAI